MILGSLSGFIPGRLFLVALTVLGVAILGVPHGGLDHWTGRRWLKPRFGGAWWSLFFPAYLAVAVFVAVGWFWMPTATVLIFFLLSAWHFGLDDEPLGFRNSSPPTGWSRHLTAIAVGGLVIWVPAVWRSGEMSQILSTVLPGNLSVSVSGIVTMTRWLAALFLPVAGAVILRGLSNEATRQAAVRNGLLWIVCVTTPIFVSFGLYFCLWHSVRGLNSLRRESGLSTARFIAAVSPLSVSAVGLIALGSFVWNGTSGTGRALSAEAIQALFIGLSAIAVPHLLLHGLAQTGFVIPTNTTTNSTISSEPNWVTS